MTVYSGIHTDIQVCIIYKLVYNNYQITVYSGIHTDIIYKLVYNNYQYTNQ